MRADSGRLAAQKAWWGYFLILKDFSISADLNFLAAGGSVTGWSGVYISVMSSYKVDRRLMRKFLSSLLQFSYKTFA